MKTQKRIRGIALFYLFSTSALYWAGWLMPCFFRFITRKRTRFPLYRKLGLDGCEKSRPRRNSIPRPSSS